MSLSYGSFWCDTLNSISFSRFFLHSLHEWNWRFLYLSVKAILTLKILCVLVLKQLCFHFREHCMQCFMLRSVYCKIFTQSYSSFSLYLSMSVVLGGPLWHCLHSLWITKPTVKKFQKRQKACILHAYEIHGVCRWIKHQIIPHFDVFKFEIGPLEA